MNETPDHHHRLPRNQYALPASSGTLMRCLTYSMKQLWQHGGYLIIRKSRVGWWPHFLWHPGPLCEDCDCSSFVPIFYRKLPFPPLWFKGRVKKGDQ